MEEIRRRTPDADLRPGGVSVRRRGRVGSGCCIAAAPERGAASDGSWVPIMAASGDVSGAASSAEGPGGCDGGGDGGCDSADDSLRMVEASRAATISKSRSKSSPAVGRWDGDWEACGGSSTVSAVAAGWRGCGGSSMVSTAGAGGGDGCGSSSVSGGWRGCGGSATVSATGVVSGAGVSSCVSGTSATSGPPSASSVPGQQSSQPPLQPTNLQHSHPNSSKQPQTSTPGVVEAASRFNGDSNHSIDVTHLLQIKPTLATDLKSWIDVIAFSHDGQCN